MRPNYALERSVRGCGWRAAGARRDFTPAARWYGLRGPLNADVRSVQIRQSFIAVLLSFLAVGVAMTIFLYAAISSHPTAAEMQAELMRHIHDLAPSDAVACGLVPIRGDSSGARNCTDLALKEKRPFWVASQIPSDDSHAWQLVFGRSDGSLHAVWLDSSPKGEPIEVAQYHVLERSPCASLRVSANEWPVFSCIRAQT